MRARHAQRNERVGALELRGQHLVAVIGNPLQHGRDATAAGAEAAGVRNVNAVAQQHGQRRLIRRNIQHAAAALQPESKGFVGKFGD